MSIFPGILPARLQQYGGTFDISPREHRLRIGWKRPLFRVPPPRLLTESSFCQKSARHRLPVIGVYQLLRGLAAGDRAVGSRPGPTVFSSFAPADNRPVIGAFHPAGQWHSPSRSGGGRSILWERRQPVCKEVTIGPVEGFPNLLSQLGRGADVLGLPVSQGCDPPTRGPPPAP